MVWTRLQLENMGVRQLWDRATDLATALGLPNPPRHREQAIEWVLEQQWALPAGVPPRACSHRTCNLELVIAEVIRRPEVRDSWLRDPRLESTDSHTR